MKIMILAWHGHSANRQDNDFLVNAGIGNETAHGFGIQKKVFANFAASLESPLQIGDRRRVLYVTNGVHHLSNSPFKQMKSGSSASPAMAVT